MENWEIRPLEDRVLIRPIKKEQERTDSGLYIPETAKKDVSEGEVVSVGVGCYARETGTFIPTYLLPGDKVLFGSQQGMPVTVDREDLRLMREGDVLMLIERKEKSDQIKEI